MGGMRGQCGGQWGAVGGMRGSGGQWGAVGGSGEGRMGMGTPKANLHGLIHVLLERIEMDLRGLPSLALTRPGKTPVSQSF